MSRKSILSNFAVKKQKNSKKIIDNGKIWNYNLFTFFSIIFNFKIYRLFIQNKKINKKGGMPI